MYQQKSSWEKNQQKYVQVANGATSNRILQAAEFKTKISNI